jgi:hypothetical protein
MTCLAQKDFDHLYLLSPSPGNAISIDATLGGSPLQVLQERPQKLHRCDHQKYFALFQRQSEPDQCLSYSEHGSACHSAEVQSFTPSESLAGHIDTFFREPANGGADSIRLVIAHPQRREFVGHSSNLPTFTRSAFANFSSAASEGTFVWPSIWAT